MSLAIVQHKSAIRPQEIPGSITLTSTPTAGNLLIVMLGCNIADASITINTSKWTLVPSSKFTSGNTCGMMLYRYVQGGDTSTLPALWTAGSTYWAYTVWEVSGVSGTFSNDTGNLSMTGHGTGGGTVTSLSPTNMSVAASSIILGGGAMYNGNADPTLSGSWTQDEVGHNNANYGSVVGGHDTGNTTESLTVTFTTNSAPAYAAMLEIKVPASTETGTATLAFGSLAFSGIGSAFNAATGGLAFGPLSFIASGAAIVTGTSALAFGPLSFAASGIVARTAVGVLNFAGISIAALGADLGVGCLNSIVIPQLGQVQPLTWNVPIADKNSGNPTPEFQKKWRRIQDLVGGIGALSGDAVTKSYVDCADKHILYAAQTYANNLVAGGGAHWYSGYGIPSSSLGVNGDFYLDFNTGNVYEKESGSWL